MGEGSGMVNFAASYPDRYFDVAIAEQHAVTLAAGMACDGVKPVVAIYSTFLQRGYDQLIHDVALQNLDVTFAIDRAGLVGQDGATHHGAFDLSYLRCIPNLIIAAPSNENDCRQMLVSAYNHTGPAAVRYPRGEGTGVRIEPQLRGVEIGKGQIVREGEEIAILNFGVLLTEAEKAGEALNATVADMRWVKPLDTDLIMQLAQTHSRFITVEENVVAGGAGSGVAEYLASQGLNIEIRHVAIDDRFIDHASQGETRIDAGLSCDDILEQANLGRAKLNGTKTAVAL
jgi:1-deoxy-D-xylulose-5-phosphate synthase